MVIKEAALLSASGHPTAVKYECIVWCWSFLLPSASLTKVGKHTLETQAAVFRLLLPGTW